MFFPYITPQIRAPKNQHIGGSFFSLVSSNFCFRTSTKNKVWSCRMWCTHGRPRFQRTGGVPEGFTRFFQRWRFFLISRRFHYPQQTKSNSHPRAKRFGGRWSSFLESAFCFKEDVVCFERCCLFSYGVVGTPNPRPQFLQSSYPVGGGFRENWCR